MFKPIEFLYEQPGGPGGAPPSPPPADPPAPPAPNPSGPSGGQPASITFTPEQQAHLNALLAAEWREAERKVKDSDDIKAALQAAKDLDDLKKSQQSAEERLTTERDQYKAQATELGSKYQTLLIQSHFTTLAAAKGVPADRLDAAFKLADLTAVRVEEDGTVKGVEKAVESLPKWLSEPPRPPAPDINSGGGNGSQIDPAAREAEVRQRFRLG